MTPRNLKNIGCITLAQAQLGARNSVKILLLADDSGIISSRVMLFRIRIKRIQEVKIKLILENLDLKIPDLHA